MTAVTHGATSAVSDEFLRDFASRWAAAWNSHDTDHVIELLDPEIVWEDTVFWPTIIEGRDGVREYTDTIWKVMPDVQFEEVQFFSAAATVADCSCSSNPAVPPPDSGRTEGSARTAATSFWPSATEDCRTISPSTRSPR